MAQTKVRITAIDFETHDVVHIRTEKPQGLDFIPGQAAEIAINKSGWEDEGRPFTFVNLPQDDDLEFMIKTYPDHKGVTEQLRHLQVGDELLINDVFGAINYKGPGTFIAGGAGVTPFISILRDLYQQGKLAGNQLIFANKTPQDIILETAFQQMLGHDFINIIEQATQDYAQGRITEDFLRQCGVNADQYIYLCGPDAMMETVQGQLDNLGVPADNIVKESF